MQSKTQKFINKANKIHSYYYDYSLVEYKHSKIYIDIICPIHGIFQQKPNNHLSGYGCNKCGYLNSSINQKYTLEEFSLKASKIHNYKYKYLSYENVQAKVEIECPIHGIFYQKGNDHLSGHGCRSCSKLLSREELSLLNYVKDLIGEYPIETSYRPYWLNRQELDIFIPHLNLALEYNGSIFHHSSYSEEYLSNYLNNTNKQKHYHFNKWKACFDNGINLISVNDYLWLNKDTREIIENKIKDIIQNKSVFDIKIPEVLNLDYDGYLLNHITNYTLIEPIYTWVKISNPQEFYSETNKPYLDMEQYKFLKIYNNGLAIIHK